IINNKNNLINAFRTLLFTRADVKNAKKAMRVVIEVAQNDEEMEIERMLDTIRKGLIESKEVHKVLSDRQDELDNIGKQKFIAYNKFVSTLKNKQKMNKNIFGDLSCGVVNNNTNVVEPNGLNLEDIWNIDLLKFAKTYCRYYNVENFLNEINEKWNKTFFELVDYKGKCPLVKNWTELREDVGEALTNVMSMKQSPFYKAFERKGFTWNEKLNAAHKLYLIADVQKLLGYMYQKCKGFDN
ncbi:hypothetical protein RFI_39447, partial [Reticulomyxa filosa]